MASDYKGIFRDSRVILLCAFVVLALSLVLLRGIHFGIEFEGGTRLPLTLEKAVEPETMDEITNVIKTRVTKFGLSQVVVRAVGDTEIYVEVPKGDPSFIKEIEKLVKEVGKFEGIIDGRVGVSSDDIIPGSIQEEALAVQGTHVTWSVGFAIAQESTQKFADAAFGKASYPVYMFLDRPENAIIVAEEDALFNQSIDRTEALRVLEAATRKENTSIPIFVLGEWSDVKPRIANLTVSNGSKAIVSNSLPASVVSDIAAMGFQIVNKSKEEMAPSFQVAESKLEIDSWQAIGLLSSPLLNPSLTKGSAGQLYQISGSARGLTYDEQRAYAVKETKKLRSVLSGGALPVRILLGSTTTIPAPLGSEFLKYSVFGAIAALVSIVLLVSLRYRAPRIILPVLLVSVAEITILVCIIGGVGTIDLSAMAGIIAAMGVSVDAQIVITDEVLKRTTVSEANAKRRLERAFQIIVTNAIVASAAMLPLLFSGLVEIVGFATSTVLGYVLGVLISRPAYAALIEHIFGEE